MRRLLASLFCAAMLFGATSAQAASSADAYPSGPISLVVCYTPGGATLFRPTGAFLPPPSVVTAARCGRFPYTRDTRKTDVPAGHKGFKKA